MLKIVYGMLILACLGSRYPQCFAAHGKRHIEKRKNCNFGSSNL